MVKKYNWTSRQTSNLDNGDLSTSGSIAQKDSMDINYTTAQKTLATAFVEQQGLELSLDPKGISVYRKCGVLRSLKKVMSTDIGGNCHGYGFPQSVSTVKRGLEEILSIDLGEIHWSSDFGEKTHCYY